MEAEARYMRRKVKAGLVEADHRDCAIIVHYEVEATVLGELGEPIVAERQENTKKIKLKTLSENTNIPRLAGEILDKCKLIHASKLSHVEELLRELISMQSKRGSSDTASGRANHRREKREDGNNPLLGKNRMPSLDCLDEYVEAMYEGQEAATNATQMVLHLARNPGNLEVLLENESLLGLLARVLQEEGHKSMELAINILYIFYSFSNFSHFHPLLFQARVGDNVLKVIELEDRRQRVRDLERRKLVAIEDQSQERRFRVIGKQQEKLLYVSFHVLINLAEEPDIERKMARRGIVTYLITMLRSRQNLELLVLSLLFLVKLAIFKENLPALRDKPQGHDKGVQPTLLHALQRCVSHSQEPLVATSLRLLFNLSFDASFRASIVSSSSGFLPKLVYLLKRKYQLPLVLRLLCASHFPFLISPSAFVLSLAI